MVIYFGPQRADQLILPAEGSLIILPAEDWSVFLAHRGLVIYSSLQRAGKLFRRAEGW